MLIKKKLAAELRRRQKELGMHPDSVIDAQSDNAIIDAYRTCSHCGQKNISDKRLKQVKTIDEFFRLLRNVETH
jgi:hypothetical protein